MSAVLAPSTSSMLGECCTTPAPCTARWAPRRGLVAPGGLFAFALYHRTVMCGLWRWEKRWYSAASPQAQRRARAVYVALLRTRFLLAGRDFRAYVADYQSARGMDFMHDVHDWMGGYPYESILAPEVDALMRRLGFARRPRHEYAIDDRPVRVGLR